MKKMFAILLTAAMLLSLAACGTTAPETTAPVTQATDPVQTENVPAETTEPAPAVPVNVMVLNGTTGFGMANLMDAASRDQAAQEYHFISPWKPTPAIL